MGFHNVTNVTGLYETCNERKNFKIALFLFYLRKLNNRKFEKQKFFVLFDFSHLKTLFPKMFIFLTICVFSKKIFFNVALREKRSPLGEYTGDFLENLQRPSDMSDVQNELKKQPSFIDTGSERPHKHRYSFLGDFNHFSQGNTLFFPNNSKLFMFLS